MKKHDAGQLLDKYNNGTCTEEEKAFVEKWYLGISVRDFNCSQEYVDAAGREIWEKLPVNRIQRPNRWFRTMAAAAILLITLAFGSYFFLNFEVSDGKIMARAHDISPGSNNAVLILANGRQINLNDIKVGRVVDQPGLSISKTNEGKVVYTIIDQHTDATSKEPEYNTIKTPNGGDYQVNLPDGTKVWLNAGSSLRFLTGIYGNERKVFLTGEAYFEVSPNKSAPFRVATAEQVIEVTGTHFNVNSYEDEPAVKTTLLEGAVKVTSLATNYFKHLIPGQQSILRDGRLNIIENVDLEAVIAWKNQEFMFSNADFRTEMRKIARWYDVEVVYDASAPDRFNLGGFISRKKNISAVLKLIELTGKVHFKIEGRRILVTK